METNAPLPNTIETMTIVSKEEHETLYFRSRASVFHEIFPESKKPWKYTEAAVFLNELDEYVLENVSYKPKIKNYATLVFHNSENSCKILKIRVFTDCRLELYASNAFLTGHGSLESKEVITTVGSQGRALKKQKYCTFLHFDIHLNISKSTSIALLNDLPMIFYPKESFSSAFHSFVKTIFRLPCSVLLKSFDTNALHEYNENFVSMKKKSEKTNSFDNFISKVIGYIHFNVTPYAAGDKLQTIEIEGRLYSIINGIYISPYAESLFKENHDLIDGIMLDTTWKVISKYVTSIMMCSSLNVGISCAFAFSGAEDSDLYRQFIDKFNDKLGVNLKAYYCESDQGSALKSVCDSFEKTHLACLRHFKVSLKTKAHSIAICEIITCRTELDLERLFQYYSERFSEITNSSELKQLKIDLHKAGLGFENGALSIDDQAIWERVSMIERIKTHMPSTTNALEATHGHLNERLPRRNDFWPSLYRIVTSIIQREFSFKEHLKHSYSRIKRLIKHRAKTLDKDIMMEQIRFYETTIDSCNCGETLLESSLYRINIPCSHMVCLGASFPSLPDVNLNLNTEQTKCTFEYTVINRTKETPTPDSTFGIKSQIMKNIRRYSHFKKKPLIEEYVMQHFNISGDFVQGKPIEYFTLTYEGIFHFKELSRIHEEKKTKRINNFNKF